MENGNLLLLTFISQSVLIGAFTSAWTQADERHAEHITWSDKDFEGDF